MKTAFFPPVRVEPALRKEAEKLLHEGETLSSFVEEAVRRRIEERKAQELFIKRGLASAAEARRTGVYFSAEEVLGELDERLEKARAAQRRKTRSRGKK